MEPSYFVQRALKGHNMYQIIEDAKLCNILCKKYEIYIKDFFSKYGHIRRFLWIWSYLLKKSLMGNFNFVQWQWFWKGAVVINWVYDTYTPYKVQSVARHCTKNEEIVNGKFHICAVR